MSQRDGEYWENRKLKLYAQVEAEEEKLARQLARYYQTEAAKLSKEIAAYYQKFGEGNVLEYRKMLVGLNAADRDLLFSRMDEFARKYPQWAHLMPVRESIYKLDEMEGLRESMRLQQLEIGAHEHEVIRPMLENDALRVSNLIAEQMGFGRNFYTVNASAIRLTVGAKWADGKDFSDRLWENKQKLADYLHNEFAQGLARGVNYDTMERQLREKFAERSRKETMRLVRTEGTFILNEAQRQTFVSLYDDEQRYTLSTIPDKNACRLCVDVEAETIKNPPRLSEAQPGINFPPMHPNCRCTHKIVLSSEADFVADIQSQMSEIMAEVDDYT